MSTHAAIDDDYLTQLRRYEHLESGISEEFLPSPIGLGTGILSLPLAQTRAPGWVICSALGKERGFLRRLEALIARRLAAEGFPVIRIRGGAETGTPPRRAINLQSRLEEAAYAVETLSGMTGVTSVGTLGVLAGGMVAGLTAGRLDLDVVVLVEPVVRGRQYLRDALRMQTVSQLAAGGPGGAAVASQARAQLEETGATTIRGFELTREANDVIAAVDLEEVDGFRGRSLLVGISRSGEPSPALGRLHDRWVQLGVESTLRGVADPLVVPFGDSYLRDVGLVRRDTRLELDRNLASVVIDWLRGA